MRTQHTPTVVRNRVAGRRRFLRTAAVAGAVGAFAGCLDDQPDGSGGDPDTGETDDSPTDQDGDDRTTDSSDRDGPAEYERAIHGLANEFREDQAVDAVEFHEEIAAIARDHSEDMVERGYFSHESPDGEEASDRLAEFYPGYCMGIGENIAHVPGGPETDSHTVAERVLSVWTESAGHRRNLLRESFDEEGIGVAFSAERVVITQKFCSTG